MEIWELLLTSKFPDLLWSLSILEYSLDIEPLTEPVTILYLNLLNKILY